MNTFGEKALLQMVIKDRYKKFFQKAWKIVWQGCLILFITLCLFEMTYRFYWFDFYRNELETLNPKEDLQLTKDKTVLVFGDSFTATQQSWVEVLRDSLKDCNIINSAIPGTSVFHQKLFFEDRIEEFHPDQIILQLYAGNDLIDYNRPQSFSKISFARNVYWWLSDQLISLQFLNYKMGQFKASGNSNASNIDHAFQPNLYNSRTINYLSANPSIISQSINPSEGFDDEMQDLIYDLIEMIEQTSIPITVLVIPHCVQTNQSYFNNYEIMGAKIDQDDLTHFTFLKRILQLEKEYTHLSVTSPLEFFKAIDIPLYYNNDPHLTPFGQGILGEFILNDVEL